MGIVIRKNRHQSVRDVKQLTQILKLNKQFHEILKNSSMKSGNISWWCSS